jgi:hypothetical protein
MARGSGIFSRQTNLRPSTMAAVAERRFGDAEALEKTGENARANGVAYLAGFVIEILLKANLLKIRRYEEIARKRPHQIGTDQEREIWGLIWRQHDLESLLNRLPELEAALEKKGEEDGHRYLDDLKFLCATWTIQARYSSRTMQMKEATNLLERVRSLKELLK